MTKIYVFTLHLNVDTKITTVNEMTRNLFVNQAKSDRQQMSEGRNHDIERSHSKRWSKTTTEWSRMGYRIGNIIGSSLVYEIPPNMHFRYSERSFSGVLFKFAPARKRSCMLAHACSLFSRLVIVKPVYI